tara:strand:+ start:1508 stop:1705 length:198 start_codon:yes stop_codon:yes gene_type:complete
MNFIEIIYLICFAATLGASFAFMWRSMGEVFKQDTKPTFTSHPELKGMKKGEKLLVFRAEEKDEV